MKEFKPNHRARKIKKMVDTFAKNFNSSTQSEDKCIGCPNCPYQNPIRNVKNCGNDKPFLPSQPNSEESQYVKGAGGCCEKCEIYLDYKDSYQCNDGDCKCHDSKHEEKPLDIAEKGAKMGKEWFEKNIEREYYSPKPKEKSKCCGADKVKSPILLNGFVCKKCIKPFVANFPLPDTTEEKYESNFGEMSEGFKYPTENTGKSVDYKMKLNNTSNEWEKEFDRWFEEYSMSVEPTLSNKCWRPKYTGETLPDRINIKSFIESLLSQSEQRVRKEMVRTIQNIVPKNLNEALFLKKIINLISK